MARIPSRIEHGALRQIDVQVAVIVVIEEGHASTHDFRHEVVARRPGKMMEVQPDFFGGFTEKRNWRWRMGSSSPQRANASGKTQGEQSQEVAPSMSVGVFFS